MGLYSDFFHRYILYDKDFIYITFFSYLWRDVNLLVFGLSVVPKKNLKG